MLDKSPSDDAILLEDRIDPVADTDIAIKFLEAWPTDMIHLTAIEPGCPLEGQSFERTDSGYVAARNWIEARQGKQNIYFSVNDISPPLGPKRAKASAKDVTNVVALHVDADFKDLTRAETDMRIKQLRLKAVPPSDIVMSGNGYGLFWRLLEKTDNKEWSEAANVSLRDYFDADACQNLDRIMRVPGTINLPNKKKREDYGYVPVAAKLEQSHKDIRVEVGSNCFDAFDKPEKAEPTHDGKPVDLASLKVSNRIKDAIRLGEGAGYKSNSEAAYAAEKALLRQFYSPDQIAAVLLDPQNAVSSYFTKERKPREKLRRDLKRIYRDLHEEVKQQKAKNFELVSFDQIKIEREPEYLVQGIIPREGVVLVYAPPKKGKSFFVLDMMLHVALGWEYRRRKVQQGTVIYGAFEGMRGMKKRVVAFRSQRLVERQEAVPFFIEPVRPDLVADADELIEVFRTKLGDTKPAAIVLDTLNRSMRGSESSDADMTAYVAAADKIKEALHCVVVIIHHTGLDASRYRGHSSLGGAVDVVIRIEQDDGGVITAEVEYARDMASGDVIASKLRQVEVGLDNDGLVITSCVVDEAEVPEESTDKRLPSGAVTMLRILKAAGQLGMTVRDWNEEARQKGIGKERRQDLNNYRDKLSDCGYIRYDKDGKVWVIIPEKLPF